MLHYALGDRLVRALTLASRPFFEAPPERVRRRPARPSDAGAGVSRARMSERRSTRSRRTSRRSPSSSGSTRAASTSCARCSRRRCARTASPTATASGSTRTPCCRAICASCGARGGDARDRRSGSRAIERRDGDVAGRRREPASLFGADPGQCRGLLGRSRRARRRAAARACSPSAGRSSPSMRRRAPSSKRCRSPRRSATSSISRPRAGGCSPRRWTRCRASRCDAQPDEYEVALAAHRMEERTIVKVERDPQPLGGAAHLHARSPPGRGLRARCGRLFLAGRAGRIRAADLAGDGGDRGFADRGRAVADGRHRRGRLKPGRFLGQPA